MPIKERFLFISSLAILLIPELFWSPISNVVFGIYRDHPYRNNFLIDSDNRGLLMIVILVQLAGVIWPLFYLLLGGKYRNIQQGRAILFFNLFLAIFIICVLYVLWATY